MESLKLTGTILDDRDVLKVVNTTNTKFEVNKLPKICLPLFYRNPETVYEKQRAEYVKSTLQRLDEAMEGRSISQNPIEEILANEEIWGIKHQLTTQLIEINDALTELDDPTMYMAEKFTLAPAVFDVKDIQSYNPDAFRLPEAMSVVTLYDGDEAIKAIAMMDFNTLTDLVIKFSEFQKK